MTRSSGWKSTQGDKKAATFEVFDTAAALAAQNDNEEEQPDAEDEAFIVDG